MWPRWANVLVQFAMNLFLRETEVIFDMPTLLLQEGFKFFFYANEHEPKHIHVENASGFAKIELATLRVVNNHMKPKDLKKSLSIVEANKGNFERKWDEYFSQR